MRDVVEVEDIDVGAVSGRADDTLAVDISQPMHRSASGHESCFFLAPILPVHDASGGIKSQALIVQECRVMEEKRIKLAPWSVHVVCHVHDGHCLDSIIR